MRKIKTAMLFVGLCMVLAACNPSPDAVEIALKTEGIKDGEEMSVSLGCTHAEEPELATATLKDGKVTFRFTSEGPRMYYVTVKGAAGRLKVMADQGDHVKVTAKAERSLRYDGVLIYEFSDVVVKGSKTHSEYEDRNLDLSRLNTLSPHYQERFPDVLEALQNAQTQQQRDSVLASDRGRQMVKAETDFFQTVQKVYSECFLENRDSWWGPLLLLDYMNYPTSTERGIYEQFSERAKQSFYGKIAHDVLYQEE
ncbi:MAG: DUF4369 domain-containing protein [Bacteroidaceae bacterium]|nr:DUF4369 domain-containing protein [Bacteroidaceae bacterium]